MEENKYEYNPEEGYDYEREENEAIKKSLRGYRVVIILLAIILAGLSVLYFNLNLPIPKVHLLNSGFPWGIPIATELCQSGAPAKRTGIYCIKVQWISCVGGLH